MANSMFKSTLLKGMRKGSARTANATRKGEISTPIITILVTVAALAVAGMAISWMASTGAMASNQGVVIIIGSPVVQNDTLYFTLKNIGTADSDLRTCLLGTTRSQNISPLIIPAGVSIPVTVDFANTFNSGQTLKGSLVTTQGTVQFSAFVQ